MQKAFLTPLLRRQETPLALVNASSGRVLARSLAGAFDSGSRRTGLLGRDRFEEGHALIIAPSNAIHTFFMRFAIDVVFVRRDGRVVSIRQALKPWRIACAMRAHAVIELPSGTLSQAATAAGDMLIITTAPEGDDLLTQTR